MKRNLRENQQFVSKSPNQLRRFPSQSCELMDQKTFECFENSLSVIKLLECC